MYLTNKILGVNNKKVVFYSFGGSSYSDNPKAISEEIHNLDPSLEIVWLFKNVKEKSSIIPNYVIAKKMTDLRVLYHLATAKIWVDNFPKPSWIYKSKKQFYIQTWHGDRGFKKILYDGRINKGRREPLIEEKICDYIITGSIYAEKRYRSAFNYKGKYMKTGIPKNDILFAADKHSYSIKSKLGIDPNVKILLYAPTFRKIDNRTQNYFDIEIDLEKIIKILSERTGFNWQCLIRAHKNIKGFSTAKIAHLDVTNYDDMAELLSITDFLITDYSSSATDFVVTDKPILLYHRDINEYTKSSREFNLDISKTGFLIAKSEDELYLTVGNMNLNAKERNEKIRTFFEIYDDGNASFRIANNLIDILKI